MSRRFRYAWMAAALFVLAACTWPAAAQIVVPAKSYTGQGGGSVGVRRGTDATSGCIHLWCTPGHWLEWTVEAPAAGAYDVVFEYGTRFSTRRKVELNGAPVPGLESFLFRNTGGWVASKEVRLPAKLALKAGKNVLRITCLDERSLCVARMRFATPGRPDILVDSRTFTGQGGGTVQAVAGNENGFFTQWDDKGHWLEWTLDIPADGDYRARVLYASTGRPVREVRVNGRVVPGMETVTFEATGGWRYWVEGDLPGVLPLKRGANVLRMTNVEQGQNLTAIVLRSPSGAETVMPAISFSGQGGGRVTVYAMPKHGALFNWDNAGHWLEWTVETPAAGAYELTLRYATRENASREVKVNGESVKGLESFAAARGLGWDDWKLMTLAVPLPLKAGKNVVRMTNVKGGLNLDELVFVLKR